jgi:serine/threonine protein phosphatase 1
MLAQLHSWFSRFGYSAKHQKKLATHRVVTIETWPSVVYAIGDVHGCYDLLRQAETAIIEDAAKIEGDKLIIVLGDVVDRGPGSAQVIDHLTALPPAGFRRICISGNHEVMMRQFLAKPSPKANWLAFGGRETLESYGIASWKITAHRGNNSKLKQLLQSYIPDEHHAFLSGLPMAVRLPGTLFVHAGLRPDALTLTQSDDDSFDLRLEALHALAINENCMVVHGHHAQEEVENSHNCLNLDTGAYATGRLSIARLTLGNNYKVIEARRLAL